MKKIILSIIALVSISLASCQEKATKEEIKKIKESGVPIPVSEAFKKQYPGENDPDWETDANGNWESHFKIDGIKYRADYNPSGVWVETENSIKKENLPKAIKDVIKSKYSEYEITEVERVQSPHKGIFFDVEFKQKGKNKDVEFREDGTEVNM